MASRLAYKTLHVPRTSTARVCASDLGPCAGEHGVHVLASRYRWDTLPAFFAKISKIVVLGAVHNHAQHPSIVSLLPVVLGLDVLVFFC